MPFLTIGDGANANRRKGGRFRTDGLTSDRGEVIDLSTSGVRLITRWAWREGEEREIALRGTHMSVTLSCRCIWVRREAMFRHVVGLAFESPNPEQLFAMHELARCYGSRLTAQPKEAA